MASRWQRLNGSLDYRAAPIAPGCYVCVANGRAIYVGQSMNLSARLQCYRFNWLIDFKKYPDGNTYVTPWGTFSNFYIKFKAGGRYGEWAMTELRLIRRLKPDFNILGRPNG